MDVSDVVVCLLIGGLSLSLLGFGVWTMTIAVDQIMDTIARLRGKNKGR